MKRIKTRVAAAATIVGLGGLAGVALNAGQQSASQPVAAKPLVQTKVIRRTVHVTKHAKPKHPAVTAPPAGASSTSSGSAPVTTGSSGGASEEPVTTSTSSTGTEEPVTTATSGAGEAPITTASSGTGGGGGEEHEVDYESAGGHEGGDD